MVITHVNLIKYFQVLVVHGCDILLDSADFTLQSSTFIFADLSWLIIDMFIVNRGAGPSDVRDSTRDVACLTCVTCANTWHVFVFLFSLFVFFLIFNLMIFFIYLLCIIFFCFVFVLFVHFFVYFYYFIIIFFCLSFCFIFYFVLIMDLSLFCFVFLNLLLFKFKRQKMGGGDDNVARGDIRKGDIKKQGNYKKWR